MATENQTAATEESMGISSQPTLLEAEQPKKEDGAILEQEHEVFARVIDFSQFKQADRAEKQEQWQVKIPRTEGNAAEGSVRVRKVEHSDGKTEYRLTTKVNAVDGKGKFETDTRTNETMFTQFKFLAETGMIKHRYVFKMENGREWEVDAVPDGKSGYAAWVRMEVEVANLDEALPELPIKVEEVILPAGLEQNLSEDERQAKVDQLLNTIFVVKNSYLDQLAEEQKAADARAIDTPGEDDEESLPPAEAVEDESEPVETEAEVEVTADDISSDEAVAKEAEEKAEEKAETDTDSEETESGEDDEPSDESEGEEVKNDEEKSLDAATESLRDLMALKVWIESTEEFNEQSRAYVMAKIQQCNEKVGIPNQTWSLESVNELSDAAFKQASLEGIVSSVARIIKAFGSFIAKAFYGMRDWFRQVFKHLDGLEARASERLSKISSPSFETEVGKTVSFNLSKFSKEGRYESVEFAYRDLTDEVLNYYKANKRDVLYAEFLAILKDLAFEDNDRVYAKNYGRLTDVGLVPEGWVRFKEDKDAVHYVKQITGNRAFVIKKPHHLHPQRAGFSFDGMRYKGPDSAPHGIEVQDKEIYKGLLSNILKDIRHMRETLEIREREIRDMQGPIFDTVTKTVQNAEGKLEEIEINRYSDEIQAMARMVLDFVWDEVHLPVDFWKDTADDILSYVDACTKK